MHYKIIYKNLVVWYFVCGTLEFVIDYFRVPRRRHPPPGPHPRGKFRGIRSRPTPKGEIEGDQIQAHTQRGNLGGSDPGTHPRGEIEGDQIQAHTQGGNWSRLWHTVNERPVRILLECILVWILLTHLPFYGIKIIIDTFIIGYYSRLRLLTRHLTVYSPKPHHSVRQRRPFANDGESNDHKS